MPDPDLTPEEQQVRRLLADARHDEPIPDDVADRLDRVLDDLRPVQAEPAPTPLRDHGAEQRRRRVRNLVLAAAAVVVLGVGISRIDLSGMGASDSDAGGSADSAARAPSADEAESGGGTAAQDLDSLPPLVLRSSTFDRQIQRYATTGRLAAISQGRAQHPSAGPSDGTGEKAYDAARCVAPGPGRRIPATYDGQLAVLVLRPADGGVRTVDLYLCGSDEPLRSTTVPAP